MYGWTGTSCSRSGRATGAARSWPRSSPGRRRACWAMTGGFPNIATFQTEVLGEIAARVIADDPGVALQYGPSEGLPSVREYLSERVGQLQGRRPGRGELIVTSGGIECIDLVCRTLLDPGDGVVVEAPTYLGAIMGFAGYQAELTGIPMDERRHARRRARGALRRRLPAEARLRHPRVPEPVGADFVARAPLGAGRLLPPLRRADPRGRRLPRALLRRRSRCPRCGRSRPDVVAPGRHVLEDLLPRLPAGLGRRARRSWSPRWPTPSRTPTSAPARSASGWSWSTAARATSTPASRAPGRSMRPTGRRCRPRSTAQMPEGVHVERADRRHVHLGHGAGRTSTCVTLRPAATEAGVAYVPGRPFYVDRRRAQRDAAVVQPPRRGRSSRSRRGASPA